MSRSRPPGGLRREAPILLAAALALFVALAGATLLVYRDGVARLEAERTLEAETLAERLAGELQRRGSGRLGELAAMAPPGAAIALFRADGTLVDALGYGVPPTLDVGGLAAGTLAGAAAVGPEQVGAPVVVALAPLAAGPERRWVRVDLPAATLAAQQRSVDFLTPLVLALTLAAAVVVFLFVRALSRPYETLLARAREAGAPLDERDELAGLVATFDRALAAMGTAPGAPGAAGELDRLRSAFGGDLDGGFLLLDREGALLAATPTAVELLGVAAPEAGAPLERALAGRPELAALLAQAVRSGEPLPRGAARVERAGQAATLGVTAEPLRGEGGRPRGWLVVVADLTELERRASRERLAEGLAQLGELSAGVAHELRNSLATLSGWVSLARRRPQDEATADCLDEIARETAQLARVVEDFLAFARPGTRRLETLDLAALLARAAQDPRLAEPGVTVSASGPAPFRGDSELLERALRNLLLNAAEAERAAGGRSPVEVKLEASGGDWRLTIADRGGGVASEVRARLFEPFASGRAGGAGLGLALARRIVVLHGGSVTLDDRPGGGTLAKVTLPAGDSDPEGNNPDPAPAE